jgi:hypothetical protein
MLLFLVRTLAVFGGCLSLFLVWMYVGGPSDIRSANSTRTYVKTPDVHENAGRKRKCQTYATFPEIPFG